MRNRDCTADGSAQAVAQESLAACFSLSVARISLRYTRVERSTRHALSTLFVLFPGCQQAARLVEPRRASSRGNLRRATGGHK
eukprot:3058831-Alexandrium_andersonii.AAC.1